MTWQNRRTDWYFSTRLNGTLYPLPFVKTARKVVCMAREWNEAHKRIVEAGGGVYRGWFIDTLVMFDSPRTLSTLALPENELTSEAVRSKIVESNKAFGFVEA